MVERIVNGVLKKLPVGRMPKAAHPVAMEKRTQPVLQALQQHGIVGLHGMGGVGKTMVANAVYNQLRAEFGSDCCYLEVKTNSSIEDLQLQMFQRFGLAGRDQLRGRRENLEVLRHRLQGRKVLLVIDNVSSKAELEHLLVPLHPDSKVLITSRDREQLKICLIDRADLRNEQCSPKVQAVDALSKSDGLNLLCQHAFREQQAPAGWEDLAEAAAAACGGLPLSLQVVGDTLRSKDKQQLGKCTATAASRGTCRSR